MKWLWKFSNEEQSYWKEIIKANHVENWMSKEVITPYGFSVWRSIRSLLSKFKANTQRSKWGMERKQIFRRMFDMRQVG